MTTAQFSPTEWKLLVDAPQWVYAALIAADRGFAGARRTEAKALEKFLSGYKTRSPLVKEILAGQKDADDKLADTSKDAEKMLEQVGSLLDRKASEDEGNAVRDLLMEAGQAIAEATREALFGDAESAKETKALARIETALKATEADKRRRHEAALAKQAKDAEARAASKRKREEAVKVEAKKKKEAEAKKRAAEAKAKERAAEAEAAKRAAEAEAKRRAAEAEAARLAAVAKAKKRAAEAEAEKKAAEAEAKKKAAEAEAEKKAAEAKKKAEAEAAAAETTRIYVVKKGDTLSGIAKEMYGKAGRWPDIYEANRDRIKKPNLIRPGWKLRIPD